MKFAVNTLLLSACVLLAVAEPFSASVDAQLLEDDYNLENQRAVRSLSPDGPKPGRPIPRPPPNGRYARSPLNRGGHYQRPGPPPTLPEHRYKRSFNKGGWKPTPTFPTRPHPRLRRSLDDDLELETSQLISNPAAQNFDGRYARSPLNRGGHYQRPGPPPTLPEHRYKRSFNKGGWKPTPTFPKPTFPRLRRSIYDDLDLETAQLISNPPAQSFGRLYKRSFNNGGWKPTPTFPKPTFPRLRRSPYDDQDLETAQLISNSPAQTFGRLYKRSFNNGGWKPTPTFPKSTFPRI